MVVFVTPSLAEFFVVLTVLRSFRNNKEDIVKGRTIIGIKQAMRSLFIQS